MRGWLGGFYCNLTEYVSNPHPVSPNNHLHGTLQREDEDGQETPGGRTLKWK